MNCRIVLMATLVLSLFAHSCTREEYDICIYGGSSAGVVAATSAARLGKRVIIVEPSNHIGGLTTGGLGQTDIGNKQVVKGLSQEFYRSLGTHYGRLEHWVFEPSVAQSIYDKWLDNRLITIVRSRRLVGVEMSDAHIVAINTVESESGADTVRYAAKAFIDATYEGDLLAAAGVSYTVGREPNEQYGETYSGVQMPKYHQFPDGVDPYVVKGKPESGLLWGISDGELAEVGTGDKLVQAYNYRICLTDVPENMKPIERPADYDSTRYELMVRLIEAQPEWRELSKYFIWSMMPNRKTDINNFGGFSTDMIGENHNYPEADWAERRRIDDYHTSYTKGLLYFMGHDERVPESMRNEMLRWGYPLDEYVDTDHWTPQLYVREGRRMVSDYVATQADCEGRASVEDGVALAAYKMDSHNCQRVVVRKNGRDMVKNEGDVQVGKNIPYPISYRSIVPKRGECDNLLVPICVSSSHIAFGSIRMEPVFMVLGQVSAMAAVQYIENTLSDVQSVDVVALNALMDSNPRLDGSTPDVMADDAMGCVECEGEWESVTKKGGYGATYLETAGGKPARATFRVKAPCKGKYGLYVYQNTRYEYLDAHNRFEVEVGGEKYEKLYDRNEFYTPLLRQGDWFPLGVYDLAEGEECEASLIVDEQSGPARADAVLLVRVE
ncbi:MAG: FAD-dependent oxidoreductase [Alistipes sp.]|nr:FAD-dependent oxidoreductase [Alistipes sp.]